MSGEDAKRAAAEAAVDAEVRPGMRLGLGTGSTAQFALEALAARLADGRLADVWGVPTSEQTGRRARELGIEIRDLDHEPRLDVTIDGADEIDPQLRLIKGLGGAHLREKVVACCSARMVVIADGGKLVERLGRRAPLPVEVIPFARAYCTRALEHLGWEPAIRLGQNGRPFVTDEGNHILDCRRRAWDDPEALAAAVEGIPGVVEHGFFLGIARAAYVGDAEGVRVLSA